MLSLLLPQKTWAHRLPAWSKLSFLCGFSILILPVNDVLTLSCVLIGVLCLYGVLGKAAVAQIALIRPLLPILAGLFLLHLYATDWQTGVAAISRLLAMVLLANAITMTTTTREMMDVIIPILAPFKIIGIAPEKIALAVALVIRFVPLLLGEWQHRHDAWRARGGGRSTWRLIPSFLLGVLRMSSNVGNALDARGFAATNMQKGRL